VPFSNNYTRIPEKVRIRFKHLFSEDAKHDEDNRRSLATHEARKKGTAQGEDQEQVAVLDK